MVIVAAGIILKDNQVFLAKRSAKQHQGGLWEFPGGKVEEGETPAEALIRELVEEVGIKPIEYSAFNDLAFDYGDKKVHLYFFLVSEFSGEAQGVENQETRWVSLAELNSYDFPAANQPIVDALLTQNL